MNRRGTDGYFPWCKTCQSTSSRKPQDDSQATNGHLCPLCDAEVRGSANRRYCSARCKERVKVLRDKYGLTVAEYRSLVDVTGGDCPICGLATATWHIDHNHATGLVTGVVCGPCNIGALARTFHSPEFIRRLLAYVEQPPAGHLEARVKETRPSTLHRMWEHSGMPGPV